jgi:purine-binding chemotaxis protein CheW
VRGVLNLRGRIITLIDLGHKLGLEPTEFSEETRNIIIESNGEFLGLLVDRISDVITTDTAKITAPPANIGGLQGKFFSGVLPLENLLVGVIDIAKVLADEAERE